MSGRPLLYYRGRVGLFHILRELNVGVGDEVLLQAFTCVAVPEGVMAAGARPVWTDLAPNSVNLDPEDLARKVTPRTKAIIVQHTFGVPAALEGILAVAKRHGLPLIEDCCHAVDSTYDEQPLGTLGTAAFWSYEWGKPIIAGLGGEVRFNEPILQAAAEASYAERFERAPKKQSAVIAIQYAAFRLLYGPRRYWPVRRIYRVFGAAGLLQASYNPVGPNVTMAEDFRWRMCDFSQARLPVARSNARAFLPEREKQVIRYADGLVAEAVRRPVVPENAKAVYSRFPIFVSRKQDLLRAARSSNLELADWFTTPVHPLSNGELKLVDYSVGSCPRAESAAAALVSLPLDPKVTPRFQEALVQLINRHALS
jgi:dTDP-4-amino-4,6-dideoxygalactose transaminase